MIVQKRSLSGYALVLAVAACYSDLAMAMSPKVEIEPYANYTGTLRVDGHAHLNFRSGICVDFTWKLTGADSRCSQLPPNTSERVCRFELNEGTSCSGQLGYPFWGRSEGVSEDPWAATRYNVSADGRSSGSVRKLKLGLSQLEIFRHVLTVSDADGVYVACGSVTSTCLRICGICFYQWARVATGICAVFAVLDSFWLINKHFRNNKNPALRKYTVRILLMVPIYSLQAFIALWFQVTAVSAELMRFIRELYEAIVIFSFLQFILTCVGGPESVVKRMDGDLNVENSDGSEDQDSGRPERQSDGDSSVEGDGIEHSVSARRARLKHIPPWIWLCPPWRSAQQMLQWCVMGTLSYVVVGCFVPPTMLIAELFFQGTPTFHFMLQIGKFLFMASSMAAINSLFELAHIFLPDLRDLSPLAKFLSVKAVVFFTFWQGLVLSLLVHQGAFHGFIDAKHRWTTQDQISQAVQHALICLEMFGASIAHHFAFPPSDYKIVRRMHIERSLALQDEADKDHRNPIMKRVQVVDFKDILQTARSGLAPTRFAPPSANGDCGSETSSEASDEASEVSGEDGVEVLEERS
mmetsp:Transcript_83921/g.218487  ORF Transcript_83921/g.218487 Transcript_83921/m.218487 type:complete len:580 (-) Transcript_83921:44-1783(-)